MTPPPRRQEIDGQEALFPTRNYEEGQPLRFKALSGRVWTRNKAQLIARYLREFVFITKHGTYVDLFSGRQNDQVQGGWSVEQVLAMQPNAFKLRHYRLFELDSSKVEALRLLSTRYPELDIAVADAADSNKSLPLILPTGSIRESEATFCLVHQRTTECEWSPVQHLATLRAGSMKPEIFYFFAQGWLNRALMSRTTEIALAQTDRWWGGTGWREIIDMQLVLRAELLANRFCEELGYKYAVPWPIYKTDSGGQIMFHMIHATDHDRAPHLMRRAYEWAVAPSRGDDEEQLRMELGGLD